jgi:peptidoglycan/LPS O-acetylase OafA/YrhL
VVVVAHHVLASAGIGILQLPANAAVLIFFAMSGYVLARAYDGRPLVFLARRVVRLWPLYAVCITAGWLAVGGWPPVADLAMWPPNPFAHRVVDLPAWSLYVEMWATPLLVPMFLAARAGRIASLAMVALAIGLTTMDPRCVVLVAFAVGVAATGWPIAWPQDVPAPLLWLGRVSYSLYLSHWVVLVVAGPVAGALLALPVAWGLWWSVERPSIAGSRMVGRRRAE